jgi:5-methylcytosine-specific restriction protein A
LKKSNWSTESRHKRGYGNDWDKLRKRILLRDNGLCQCQYCQGGKIKLTLASQVDHIIPKAKGGTDAESNLQAINAECHKRKTAEENGGTYRDRIKIGVDGWPIDSPPG